MLILEALTYTITQQNAGQDTLIEIHGKKSLGKTTITLVYDGPRYNAEKEEDDFSPEYKILNAYAEKIEYTYSSHQNMIKLTVSRSSTRTMVFYLISILIGIAIYLPIRFLTGEATQEYIHNNIVFPVERVFTNSMLLVGTVVTFLSLLKNLTDAYILSGKNSNSKKLQKMTIVSSIISIVLAIGASYIIIWFVRLTMPSGSFSGFPQLDFNLPLSDFINSLMPSDIFSVFQTFSPFPMLIFAAIVTYSCCSVGPYFDKVKKGIEVLYSLFARILNVVMFVLPFFVTIAILDVMLHDGFAVLLNCFAVFLLMVGSLIYLAVYYLLRLRMGGVRIIPFVKKLGPLIRENFGIASSIDAVPYNIRYCARVYKMDRKRLEGSLPTLAQLNLDGNCFLITSLSILIMFLIKMRVHVFSIITICVIVFCLSLGAPNQPGSCLIGMLIILFYLKTQNMIALAILGEVLCGSLQNIVNVIGDIVTVAVLDAEDKRSDVIV